MPCARTAAGGSSEMGERAFVPRPPAPDDVVWLLNTHYERQDDGSWLGWVEPLTHVGTGTDRVFEVRGLSAHDAKLLLGERLSQFFSEIDSEADAEFLRRHGRQFLYRDVPPVAWPPRGDSWCLLDFPPPEEGG